MSRFCMQHQYEYDGDACPLCLGGAARALEHDPELTIQTEAPCNLTFQNAGGEVGRLSWDDGTFRFEGVTEESAVVFFNFISNLANAPRDRRHLNRIREIIENVDNRCAAADGPVTPTLDEMMQSEISEIYKLTELPS